VPTRTSFALVVAPAIAIAVAAAPPAGAAPPPAAVVHLLVAQADGTVTGDATLTCVPDGGTHPLAGDACSALTAVDGRFEALRGTPDRFCPMIFAPVTAFATGVWDGTVVRYQHTYPNSCLLEVASGPVFTLRSPEVPRG
jgi:hypothetical protein